MTTKSPTKRLDDGQHYIFRPYIRLANGTVIWAKAYGLKAFKIPVGGPDNDNKQG